MIQDFDWVLTIMQQKATDINFTLSQPLLWTKTVCVIIKTYLFDQEPEKSDLVH